MFVNAEPAAVSGIEPPTALLVRLRERGIGLVIELTERALTGDPARPFALCRHPGRLGPAPPAGAWLWTTSAPAPAHWR